MVLARLIRLHPLDMAKCKGRGNGQCQRTGAPVEIGQQPQLNVTCISEYICRSARKSRTGANPSFLGAGTHGEYSALAYGNRGGAVSAYSSAVIRASRTKSGLCAPLPPPAMT